MRAKLFKWENGQRNMCVGIVVREREGLLVGTCVYIFVGTCVD